MEYFIIICVVAFLFVVLLVNIPKIKEATKNRSKRSGTSKEKKQKVDSDTLSKKENLSYDEKEFKQKLEENVVVDNLNHESIKEQSLVDISENEIVELEAKRPSSGGRKYNSEEYKSTTEEELYSSTFDDEFDSIDDLHDMYDSTQQSEISEEIKNLSPELKAILISNLLNKRDDI